MLTKINLNLITVFRHEVKNLETTEKIISGLTIDLFFYYQKYLQDYPISCFFNEFGYLINVAFKNMVSGLFTGIWFVQVTYALFPDANIEGELEMYQLSSLIFTGKLNETPESVDFEKKISSFPW